MKARDGELVLNPHGRWERRETALARESPTRPVSKVVKGKGAARVERGFLEGEITAAGESLGLGHGVAN